MRKLIFISIASLLLVSCSKDKSENGNGKPDRPKFTIINNGGAVDNIVSDPYGEPLEIVQTIPSFYNGYDWDDIDWDDFGLKAKKMKRQSNNIQASSSLKAASTTENTFPTNLPIMFFFNNKIYLNSIQNNFVITVNGTEVNGTIVVNVTPKGNAIITFTPEKEFAVGKEITVKIKKGMKSSGGLEMWADVVVKYVTTQSVKGNFGNNKGFENGTDGVFFVGDGAVRTGIVGPLGPYEGNKFAAISSGDRLVSENGRAIGGASSMMVLGPINTNISTLSFYYDFISAEFNDYVDTEFDDCAIITVYGPNGSYSELITSVNTIRYDNLPFEGFPGMPDDGDDYAGHTGWLPYSISASKIGSVGTPAYIIFTVTDVADDILSSILAVDAVSY